MLVAPFKRSSAGLLVSSFLAFRPAGLACSMQQHHAPLSSSLEASGVIPDVLPPFHPKVQCRLSFDDGRTTVKPGAQLTPQATVHVPLVSFEGTEPGKFYTLTMTDPDAPSPHNPSHREWLHWIVTNVAGDAQDIAGGQQVMPYAPPTPPKGNHRYVFAVFEQPGQLSSSSIGAPAARGKFHTMDFAKKHGLTLVGATFFKAAHQG